MALDGDGWSTPRPGRFTPQERDPVPIVQETGRAPGPVWTAAKNFAPTGIPAPGRPARSKSLYRLHYRGPQKYNVNIMRQLCCVIYVDKPDVRTSKQKNKKTENIPNFKIFFYKENILSVEVQNFGVKAFLHEGTPGTL